MTSRSAWEPSAYRELRGLAASVLEEERRNHTLQPTELVHEVWLKLRHQPQAAALPQGEFLRLAATVMRHVLTDHARRIGAEKRGGGQRRVTLTEVAETVHECEYLEHLDAALGRLADTDTELAQLVELRFFAGCTTEELAHTLRLSPRTVKRRWRFARAWLHRTIAEDLT